MTLTSTSPTTATLMVQGVKTAMNAHVKPTQVVAPPQRAPTKSFSIRDLSKEFGVTARALRFYEDKDLLHPARDGMTRIYSTRDRARLQLILRGKRVGLSLNEIREILDLYELPDGARMQNRKSLEKFKKQLVALERQKQDVEAAIETLKDACARLEDVLAKEGPGPETEAQVRAYEAVARTRMG